MRHDANSRLKVGVIGCGDVGLIHARAYAQNPAVDLVGVCDTDEERLKECSSSLGVRGYSDTDGLLDSAQPDLVSVVVRFDCLVPPVRQCLEAGVSVLSEKPVSFSPSEILDLAELADRQGLRFEVNFNQRFTPASAWFRQLRESGRFGRTLWTLAQYNQGGSDDYFALREHMIHQFDQWRYHIGDVSSVSAQASWSDAGEATRHPEAVSATMKFVDGPVGTFINGAPYVGGMCNYFELVGTDGRGCSENFIGRAVFRPNEGPAETLEQPWIGDGGTYWDTFATHIDLVVAAMLKGEPLPVTGWDAFEVQCICDAVIQAIESGAVVDVQLLRQARLDVGS